MELFLIFLRKFELWKSDYEKHFISTFVNLHKSFIS